MDCGCSVSSMAVCNSEGFRPAFANSAARCSSPAFTIGIPAPPSASACVARRGRAAAFPPPAFGGSGRRGAFGGGTTISASAPRFSAFAARAALLRYRVAPLPLKIDFAS